MLNRKVSFSVYVLLLTLIFSTGRLAAQSNQDLSFRQGSAITIKAGLNDFHIKDEYLSPYIFNSLLFSSAIGYEIHLGGTKHVIDVNFGIGSTESDKQTGEVEQILGSLSYSFLYQFSGYIFNLNAGAGISSWFSHSDFNPNIAEGGGFSDESWFWSHAINIMAEAEYPVFQEGLVTAGITIPFFRVVSRPDNGHWLTERNNEIMIEDWTKAAAGGRGEFIWDSFILSTNIEYKQKISSSFALLANYHFNYTSSDRPLSLGMYMNNFQLGLEILL